MKGRLGTLVTLCFKREMCVTMHERLLVATFIQDLTGFGLCELGVLSKYLCGCKRIHLGNANSVLLS